LDVIIAFGAWPPVAVAQLWIVRRFTVMLYRFLAIVFGVLFATWGVMAFCYAKSAVRKEGFLWGITHVIGGFYGLTFGTLWVARGLGCQLIDPDVESVVFIIFGMVGGVVGVTSKLVTDFRKKKGQSNA
jgi:hypothetical protein